MLAIRERGKGTSLRIAPFTAEEYLLADGWNTESMEEVSILKTEEKADQQIIRDTFLL